MKALFDPLVIKKVTLANPAEIMAQSKALDEAQKRRAAAQAPLDALVAPFKQKLYEDRVAMLPADVQAIIRKPEKERTRRGTEDRRRLFPGAAHRWRQDPGSHAA